MPAYRSSSDLRSQRIALGVLALGLVTGACNRSGYLDDCTHIDDPGASPGARIGKCPDSATTIDSTWLNVAGRVWSGENGQQATIRVEATEGFQAPDKYEPLTLRTDAFGSFGPIANAPYEYDLVASFANQVLVVRGPSFRYFEPALDAPFAPYVRGGPLSLTPPVSPVFTSHVDLQLKEPLAPGKALYFFTLGDATASVTGDAAHGLTIATTSFTVATTLYAFVYDAGSDLSTVTQYTKAPLSISAGQSQLVTLDFADPVEIHETTVNLTGPRGYALASLDSLVVYSRTSRAYISSFKPGVVTKVPFFKDSLATHYRARLVGEDGSIIDSGLVGFPIFDPSTTYALDAVLPPTVDAPADGAHVALTDPFLVHVGSGGGVYEHTFAPAGGTGPTVHLLTASGEAHLPDFAAAGLAIPHGAYTWTARRFPNAHAVADMGGRDVRRGQPSASAAPRTISFP